MQQIVYVIVIDGEYTDNINGQDVPTQKTSVAAAFSDQKSAEQYLESAPQVGPKWGICTLGIYSVVIDGEPDLS